MKSWKISKEILNKVSIQENTKNRFIIYSKSDLSNKFKEDNIKFEKYTFLNAYAITSSIEYIKNLSDLTCVKKITYFSKVCAQINVAKDFCNIENLTHKKHFGKGVTICFIDTGITPHLDFLTPNRIIDFVDLINNKKIPYDDNGHGTFIAGVASGNGFLSCGKFSGIAPLANIVSIKALDSKGETSAETILKAMQYVHDNKERFNIKVVCMSFGAEPSGRFDPLSKGAEALWREGITVVVSAGNAGPKTETIKSPAVSSKVISVGSIDDGRTNGKVFIPNFSSRGPSFGRFKPDLVAPSVNLVSCSNLGFYSTMSGTSVAAPFVAGICAILIESNPSISPEEVKFKLLQHCTPLCDDKNKEGFGFIQF